MTTPQPGPTLDLELLGSGVRIHCADGECRERLRVCYGRSLRPATRRTEPELEVRVEVSSSRPARYHVDVPGREPLQADSLQDAVRGLNHELMHALMRRAPRLYFVHAAVVALKGPGAAPRGVLLPGLSRAGKSTLALALVQAGARYLSDELLAYDPLRRVARAFPRALKVRDECASYFPDLAPHFVGTGEGRFLRFEALGDGALGDGALDDEALDDGPLADEVSIHTLVLPRWSEERGPPELEPITAGAALLELAASSLNFGTHREASLDSLTALVERATAYRLVWNEPHAAARALLGALGEPA